MQGLSNEKMAVLLAREHLLAYSIAQWPGYRPAAHHRRIADALMAVERGEIKRLIITMPPRHGKSMEVSQFFPPWYLGRSPEKYIIASTYAQELADDFGRKVRDQMADPLHQAIFPECSLSETSKAANRFGTDQGGTYFAVGAGGSITGRGGHLLLIDDPIKGREEAESETMRRKLKDWYQSVAYTRLMPGGAIIVIQTRWHEDDLAGWLLREHASEDWTVLSLPAIDDKGNALWPEAYDLEALERIRKAVGPRDWNALYQQQPVPDTGDYFRRDWFKRYDKPPKHLRVYAASDYAVTANDGDYTEHGVFGVDPDGDMYVLDWWSGQTAADEWIESMLDLCETWKPITWYGESGPIRRSIEPFLKKRMQERKCYQHIEWVASINDKPTRARSFQARASMGKVYLPATQMGDELIGQLLRFPAGLHDDKVDVCSLIGRVLDQTHSANPPRGTEGPKYGTLDWLMKYTNEPKQKSKYRSG